MRPPQPTHGPRNWPENPPSRPPERKSPRNPAPRSLASGPPIMEKHPLSDLSFFRFPALTSEVVWNIVLLFALLGLTVVVTVILHRRLGSWTRVRARRQAVHRFSSERGMPDAMRGVLEQLIELADVATEFELMGNARVYEETVARLLARRPDAAEFHGEQLQKIRRALHLNVMNPELELVSTRQLLQDLPVRILIGSGVGGRGGERLDLYCSVFKITEEVLIFDLERRTEVLRLVRANPEALLVFWRPEDGETVFRIFLEPIEGEGLTLFRAAHVFREDTLAQRAAFRLTTDIPLRYGYLEARAVLSRRGGKKDAGKSRTGEGRLVDLGYGGASLELPQLLPPGGFAQLNFELNGRPMEVMFEVLAVMENEEGNFLIRGRFPAHTDEGDRRLRKYLLREQTKRLRENEILTIRTGS